MIRLSALSILWVFLACPSAQADMLTDCDIKITASMTPEDLDIKLSGCTEIIETSDNEALIAAGYTNRALAYLARMDGENAVADQTKAIKLRPENANFFQNRGAAYLYYLRQPKMALADFERALILAPDDPAMHSARGSARNELGNSVDALVDFGKAIALDPDYGPPYFERGVIYFGRDLFDQAADEFTQSIRLNWKLDVSYFHRGIQFELLGRTSEAIDDYRKVLEINPAVEPAKVRLRALGVEP